MTDTFIIQSFWQEKSNCAAISLIKAAMIRYGFNKIFTLEKRNRYVLVILKNKRPLALTQEETRRLNASNAIRFAPYRDPVKKNSMYRLKYYVELCFAIMVRQLQLEGYEGKQFTESKAIQLLTRTGMSVNQLPGLLGLKRKTTWPLQFSLQQLSSVRRRKAVLMYSETHITLLSDGVYEVYGKLKPLQNAIPVLRRKPAIGWFQLK